MSETLSQPEDIEIKARFINEIVERLSTGKMDGDAAQLYLSKLESTVEEVKATLAEVITINNIKPISRPKRDAKSTDRRPKKELKKKDEIFIPERIYDTGGTEELNDLNSPNPATRILEKLTPTEIEVTRSTPYVLLNIDLITHLLGKANISIPPDELTRMRSVLETADFSSVSELTEIIINETEDRRRPLITITPSRILHEGEDARITTKILYEVTKMLQKEGVWRGRLMIGSLAFDDTKNQPLHMRRDSELRIYTTVALKGSKELADKAPSRQTEHQDTAFDDYRLARNYKVDLSLAWALLLWELQENDHPQIQPFCVRLNGKSGQPPIYLDYKPGRIAILSPEKAKRPLCGMGTSCVIPVKMEEEIGE